MIAAERLAFRDPGGDHEGVARDLGVSRAAHGPHRPRPQLTEASRRRVEELFATDDPDERLINDVVAIVAEAGGIDRARQRGEQLAQEAEDVLEPLPDSPVRSALTDAISYVMDRRS